MTIDEIIKEIDSKASGRTRWKGQELLWDEALVAEIRRLREAVRVLAEVAVAATSDAEENYYTNIRRAMMKVSANPIAAAAVEAARKGGER